MSHMRSMAMRRRPANRRRFILMLSCVAACLASGCSQYIDPNVPEPIRPFVDPKVGRDYLLYRPFSYDPQYSWPLVVVCHGGFPDSPNRQLRAWTQLAESYGFIVVAPTLESARHPNRKYDRQIDVLREDEKHVLATVRHVRAGHNISEDRIFIHGWSGGALPALYIGLDNPTLFRAVSVARPKCNTGSLVDLNGRIDPHQPVFVRYAVSDAVTGKHGTETVTWLHETGVDARVDTSGPARKTDGAASVAFFENIIRRRPWVHVRAFATGGEDPYERQFKLRSSYTPRTFRWTFGDGAESPVAAPVHSYDEPGSYLVTVTVDGPHDEPITRSKVVRVP